MSLKCCTKISTKRVRCKLFESWICSLVQKIVLSYQNNFQNKNRGVGRFYKSSNIPEAAHRRCSIEKGFFRATLLKVRLYATLLAQMVSREFFKSTYFMEHLPVTPSDVLKLKGTLMQIWKSAHIFVFIWT